MIFNRMAGREKGSVFSPRQADTRTESLDRKRASVSVEEEEVVVGEEDNTASGSIPAPAASLLRPVEDVGWSSAWLQITLQLETERKVMPSESNKHASSFFFPQVTLTRERGI